MATGNSTEISSVGLSDCLRDDEGSCSESKDYFEKYLGDDIEEDGCQHDENGLCLEDDADDGDGFCTKTTYYDLFDHIPEEDMDDDDIADIAGECCLRDEHGFCLGNEDENCIENPAPLVELNTPSGGWLNVFFDFKFDCETCVKSWQFYATVEGDFFATLWRPSEDGSQITLVGKNLITAASTGEQTIDVPDVEQICVRIGDIIGVQYTNKNIPGVVPYEQSGVDSAVGLTDDQLSRLINEDIADNDVPIGTTKTVKFHSVKRLPALKPVIGDVCFNNPAPLIELNRPSDRWLNVFLDLHFDCATSVLGWRFHATQSGSFFATVWRTSEEESKVTLVGKNFISVESPGLKKVDVPENETICVRHGDIIGIQYANTNGQGVVPYEESGGTSTAGINQDQLSRLFNEEVGDGSLPVGREKTVSVHAVKRLPALKPIISVGSNCFNNPALLVELNTPSGGWLNVFLDLTFNCWTTVERWEYHATKTGAFYATVWRPSADKSQLTLIGKNLVTAESTGEQTFDVPDDQKICVRPGDIIGIHYASTDGPGVVSYEQSGKRSTDGVSEQLSRLFNEAVGDSSLPLGKIKTVNIDAVKRLPALTAIVS